MIISPCVAASYRFYCKPRGYLSGWVDDIRSFPNAAPCEVSTASTKITKVGALLSSKHHKEKIGFYKTEIYFTTEKTLKRIEI